MQPTPPFWFMLRQGKMESVGADSFRLTAPNLTEAFISIRPGEHNGWLAAVRLAQDGPEIARTEGELATPQEAWEATFELYRIHLVV